jgi:hypothetical protein
VNLGVAVFTSVVLILAVYHKGFRKVVLWSGAITVILALLGAGSYFAYDRYTTWQKTKAHNQAVKDCVARFQRADHAEVACEVNPAVGIAPPGANGGPGFQIGSPAKQDGLGSPPGISADYYFGQAKPSVSAKANTTKKSPTITATVTCDVVVYDRSEYGEHSEGDPQAIDSLHVGDTVQYVGRVTIGDQDIIKVHGRKGYVNGCVEVKPRL